MESPKVWTGSILGRRTRLVSWGRFCYRLLYAMSFLAAVYAVLAHFRSASPISTSDTDEVASPGFESFVNNVLVVLPSTSRAEQEQRRWVDKPNSLCFGLGNVTILTGY